MHDRQRAFDAAIFDMDGLLIDSEPLWQRSEIQVFGDLGVHLTPELCRDTMGMRIDEVVEYWYGKRPWTGATQEEVVNRVVDAMVAAIHSDGTILPGVHAALDFVSARVDVMAVASSSTRPVIDAVMEVSGLLDRFATIRSAADEAMGKPDPAVYLSTASELGVPPQHCIAFEDSVRGVAAAKAAGMTCIAVPEAQDRTDEFANADLILASLTELPSRWAEIANVRRPSTS